MSKSIIVYRTITQAITIDLAEEGLPEDAHADDILDAAEAYEDDSWDDVDTNLFLEEPPKPLPSLGYEEIEDDTDWADDTGEFPIDDDSEDLPEFPESEDDGF